MLIGWRKIILVFSISFGVYQLGFTENCPTYGEYSQAQAFADALQRDFRSFLHAQHLVSGPVTGVVKSHLANPDPPKALVLSFHGPTGVGKNFVSSFIADNLFEGKRNSEYVNIIIGPHHFPHRHLLDSYTALLHSWIRGNVSLCERSLFIFDEVDKFPAGLIDTVKGYLEHYPTIGGIVFRKAIFIFISNTGGEAIKQYVYDERHRQRRNLTMKELEEVVQRVVYKEDGGLKKSQVLDKNLVSLFVAFLPMERAHVRLCVQDDLRNKGYDYKDEDVIEDILQELTFFPPNVDEDQIQFSETGCKRVPDKVDVIAFEQNLVMLKDRKKKHEL